MKVVTEWTHWNSKQAYTCILLQATKKRFWNLVASCMKHAGSSNSSRVKKIKRQWYVTEVIFVIWKQEHIVIFNESSSCTIEPHLVSFWLVHACVLFNDFLIQCITPRIIIRYISKSNHLSLFHNTVEPCYKEDLGTMKITLLYQGKKQNKEIWRAKTSKITLIWEGVVSYLSSL